MVAAAPTSLDELRRRYGTEARARGLFEKLMWPQGRFCPHCGGLRSWPIRPVGAGRKGFRCRPGLYECRECGDQFTVTTKTPLHATKLPLWKWVAAMYYELTSSKGIASTILATWIGVTQKTAWKMLHAIREMKERGSRSVLLDGVVQIDVTYMGGKPRQKTKKQRERAKERGEKYQAPRGRGTNRPMLLLAVEVSEERRAAAVVIKGQSADEIREAVKELVAPTATVYTDSDAALTLVGKDFTGHGAVNHSQHEYAADGVDINTVESLAALFDRTQLGTYHYISRRHLQRYANEITWRWMHKRTVIKHRRHDGTPRRETHPLPFLVQLAELLPRSLGRQVRRCPLGGIAPQPPLPPAL